MKKQTMTVATAYKNAAKTRKEKKPKPPDLTNPKSKANIQKPVYRGNSNNRRNLKDYWTT